MGYSSHAAEFKIECVGRYFSEPPISIRGLAREKGVSFATLAHWIAKARKAGMLNPGEKLPAMVEVALPPAPAETPGPAASAATMMAVIRTALRNGLIPERYLAWLFENSNKLPTECLMPWADDVPETCKALNR